MNKLYNTYIDENGYFRYKNTNRLVHRDIAWKYIYSANRKKYPLRFRDYQVHHIDGEKQHNEISNLQLVIEKEHEKIQGYNFEKNKPQTKIQNITLLQKCFIIVLIIIILIIWYLILN